MSFPPAACLLLMGLMVLRLPMEPGNPDAETGDYGVLDKHAPQVVFILTGLLIGIAGRIGLSLTEGDVTLLETFLTVLVPPLLAYIGAKLTELYTYSKRTRDADIRRAAEADYREVP